MGPHIEIKSPIWPHHRYYSNLIIMWSNAPPSGWLSWSNPQVCLSTAPAGGGEHTQWHVWEESWRTAIVVLSISLNIVRGTMVGWNFCWEMFVPWKWREFSSWSHKLLNQVTLESCSAIILLQLTMLPSTHAIIEQGRATQHRQRQKIMVDTRPHINPPCATPALGFGCWYAPTGVGCVMTTVTFGCCWSWNMKWPLGACTCQHKLIPRPAVLIKKDNAMELETAVQTVRWFLDVYVQQA